MRKTNALEKHADGHVENKNCRTFHKIADEKSELCEQAQVSLKEKAFFRKQLFIT